MMRVLGLTKSPDIYRRAMSSLMSNKFERLDQGWKTSSRRLLSGRELKKVFRNVTVRGLTVD